ncbi:uncharacterized protein BDV14DRAFT_174790 [Aspergillus stella-maris]|uniref:uncharacterized protein n=1 Tax=Aspergillus stella-maris TaxID=1810926 RepID=UPI003CCE4C08
MHRVGLLCSLSLSLSFLLLMPVLSLLFYTSDLSFVLGFHSWDLLTSYLPAYLPTLFSFKPHPSFHPVPSYYPIFSMSALNKP